VKQQCVTISNKLGLHARASAKFVGVVEGFCCEVYLQRDAMKVNGRSLMAILTLAASQGTEIMIITDGEQEEEASAALVQLVEQRFGEVE